MGLESGIDLGIDPGTEMFVRVAVLAVAELAELEEPDICGKKGVRIYQLRQDIEKRFEIRILGNVLENVINQMLREGLLRIVIRYEDELYLRKASTF